MTENTRPRRPATDHLGILRDSTEGFRVSLYVPLPENRGFDEVQQFPAFYRHTVKVALDRLAEIGAPPGVVERARDALEAVDPDVASLPSETRALALFVGPVGSETFALAAPVERAVYAGRSFHVRPLLSALGKEIAYRVLALSTNRVALFEGDARELREVEADGVPKSLVDALGGELSDPSLQFHSTATGGEAAVFHGHGGADSGRTTDRKRFHQLVGRAVTEFWSGRREPLVLATDPANDGAFRKVASLAGLLDQTAEGNPDRLTAHELHERTLPVVRAWAAEREVQALAHAREAPTVAELGTAIDLAAAGRVARLWLDADERIPGHLEGATFELVDGLGDEDALDELATLVLAMGGEVLVGKEDTLPGPSPLLAELRG